MTIFPNFELFLDAQNSISNILISWTFLTIVTVTFISLIYKLSKFNKNKEKINNITTILNPYSNQINKTQKEKLKLNFSKQSEEVKLLWQNFDNSLIFDQNDQLGKIKRTTEAKEFFNNQSISFDFFQNNNFYTSASILFITSIGIFLTLINSAQNLELQSNSSLLSGASLLGFWGTLATITTISFNKILANKISSSIFFLQNKIDSLFVKDSISKKAQNISDNTLLTTKLIDNLTNNLTDKLGNRIYNALIDSNSIFKNNLVSELQRILEKQIDKLSEDIDVSNNDKTNKLLTSFDNNFSYLAQKNSRAQEKLEISIKNTLYDINTKSNQSIENNFANLINKSEEFSNIQTNNISDAINTSTQNMEHLVAQKLENLKSSLDELSSSIILVSEQSENRTANYQNLLTKQIESLQNRTISYQDYLSDIFNNQFKNLITAFDSREENAAKREENLVSILKEKVAYLVLNTNQQNKAMSDFVENQLTRLSKEFNDSLIGQKEREISHNQVIENQLERLRLGSNSLIKIIETKLETEKEYAKSFMEQQEKLQETISLSADINNESSKRIRQASFDLKTLSDDVTVCSQHVKSGTTELVKSVSTASNMTEIFIKESANNKEEIKVLRGQLLHDAGAFRQVVKHLQQLLDTSSATFMQVHQRQENYLNSLKNSSEDAFSKISSKVSLLLNQYSKDSQNNAKKHLDIWEQRTSDYTDKINNAAKVLSNVVGNIEFKVR